MRGGGLRWTPPPFVLSLNPPLWINHQSPATHHSRLPTGELGRKVGAARYHGEHEDRDEESELSHHSALFQKYRIRLGSGWTQSDSSTNMTYSVTL